MIKFEKYGHIEIGEDKFRDISSGNDTSFLILKDKYCPYYYTEKECGSWCPLFTVDNIESKINLCKEGKFVNI